jgi:flagellar biosynthetic protein FliP
MILRLLLLLLITIPSFGAEVGGIDLLHVSPSGDGEKYSTNVETLLFMTALSLLPVVIVMLTPFLRNIIVFSMLRQAIGTMHSPPNNVLVGMAMLVSFIVMQPTLEKIYEDAYVPYQAGSITSDVAVNKLETLMKSFWLSVTNEEELIYFHEIMNAPKVEEVEDLPLKVIIPAFVYSEIKMAFKIGLLLFVPFIIIDLVVASSLMGLGMMMLSPMMISLPFKICAFVILDGWGLITSSMIGSFGVM